MNWIKKAIKRPGSLRAKAKKRGLSTKEFVQKVLKNPHLYDKRTVRQARLAKVLMKLNRKN